MDPLTPSQRRELRAKAHHLQPFVTVGQHGLTPAVLHEIDLALLKHELIKVRVFSDARDEREAMLQTGVRGHGLRGPCSTWERCWCSGDPIPN
jgi:putative YhbY family RNA-binding protein